VGKVWGQGELDEAQLIAPLKPARSQVRSEVNSKDRIDVMIVFKIVNLVEAYGNNMMIDQSEGNKIFF
jgi:hypothetical protein